MSSTPAAPTGAGSRPADAFAARFGVPDVSALHVVRPRLVAALDDAASVPLVLVSGPAGSGKTSLLAEWLHSDALRGEDLGWITFEDEDTRLWQPLAACLAQQGVEVPPGAERGPDLLLGHTGLAALTAAVAASDRRRTLVVDGYELRSAELAAEVTHLLDHAGGRLRLVFAARVDPALPLYRFRLEDAITEVRAADLRLTDAEAAELLAGCGVPLPAAVVHDLNLRLGGWAAGLRFTARALARHEHPVASAAAVVAQDFDINEYLLAEVLQVQDPQTRDLLLRTCVPDLLPPGLAEELAGPNAQRGLAELVRTNMFIEPVPDRPGTHRYHPFFRDLLRAQLAFEDPEGADGLHRRAAGWLHAREMRIRSVAQLATGGLWPDVAAQLVDDLLVVRLVLGQDERLVEMARRVPDDVTTVAACLVRAALALASWDPAGCGEELRRARVAAGPTPLSGDDPTSLAFAMIDSVRAATSDDAEAADDLLTRTSRALAAARRPAAGLAGPEPESLLEVAGALIALRRGDLGRARAALARVEERRGLPARLRSTVLGYRGLTDALEGRLTQARLRATDALSLADDGCVPPGLRNPAASTALALVALERDDLGAARQHVAAARLCRALVCEPVCRTIVAGVLAHVEAATGEARPALAHLEALCDRADVSDPWLAGWLRVQSAELAVTHGLPGQALRSLDTLAPQDSPSGEVVAAAAYAEQGRRGPLERSLTLARATARPLPVEVTRLLVEGVHESRLDSSRGAAPLVEQALQLAAREEARRPFREAPPAVRRLLARNPQLLERHPWLTGTVPASPKPAAPRTREPVPRSARSARSARAVITSPDGTTDVGQLVVEPLTAKETEVLTHLEELLTTEEIAEKMFVSVNTVRTHVRSILRKLGVNRRNSAVRRARELGLLDQPLP